jgi:preprotein translocase subunit SecA
MYHKLAGMTGTATTEAGELWQIYKLDVVEIPTNVPMQRKDMEDKVYRTMREKYNAVVDEIASLTKAGRPVLVGTTSVEISELLSRMLKLRGVRHNVLNAKLHQKEADIVAEAGKAGTVTIATNMAGRGTDIKLGEGVKEAGGLAIVGTERHESRRVDRQLRGRAGRQGDPGSSQFFVSLEDNLMRLFGSERISNIMLRMGIEEGEVIQHSMITKSIERAQRKVEENNFGIRKRLLEYDDVMNSQRSVIYAKRKNALFGERLEVDLNNTFYDTVDDIVTEYKEISNFEGFKLEMIRIFTIDPEIDETTFNTTSAAKLTDLVFSKVSDYYDRKVDAIAQQAF